MSTLASSRKRASTPSSPSTSLSKKLKLTSISPPQPMSPATLTTLLNQDPADLMPDLRMQVTCLKLFLLVIAHMPEATPKHKQKLEVGYRQAVVALNKMDILGIATKRMIAAVNDIEKLTRDIDEILEFDAPSFPNVQLKRSCEDFMGAYEERLASLDPMRENGCDDIPVFILFRSYQPTSTCNHIVRPTNKSMSKLRQDYNQRASTFAGDLSKVYKLRVKVDRANREFKESIGKQIDHLMLLQSEIIQEADAIRAGGSLLLTEQEISTLAHHAGIQLIPEHWLACLLENIRENEKLKAQEQMVKNRYQELYHQRGRPRMTLNNGHYTRRMDWYARRLFRREAVAEDERLPVKTIKRLEFLKQYTEPDAPQTDFEDALSA
ncbi:uncharacterized protein FTJAE_11438 [Fusarium tjaetaba]|uniref:Uncharacterized protein n=1 Tax=Fusarium tjaetaba TaxID=1567544 RepID=A0A8H5QV25_9HYPO|nr:uncharacterized protein FTJAE_11438 [Fusarium tjaetaba]KAF5621097.1 hypothetical protein FTJAE_11438 [Fusarium tjaetaba]